MENIFQQFLSPGQGHEVKTICKHFTDLTVQNEVIAIPLYVNASFYILCTAEWV